MTQEFAKTPILRQPGKILPPRYFPRKNQKKLVFFFIFVLSSFLKKIVLNYGSKGVRSPIDESKAVSYTDQYKTPAFHNNSTQHKGGK
jgi:hypothetical protein